MAERKPPAAAVAATAAALAALLPACYGPNAPFGAPCASDSDCPSDQSCAPERLTCGPLSKLETWRDDAAADFATAGAYTEEIAIEPAGFVSPTAYFGGGLRLSGIDRNAIPDKLTPWNELAPLPRTGTRFVRGLPASFEDVPLGLGLTRADNITIVVEGEIYLDVKGMWGFELTANDLGFLELAPPNSTSFTRVVTDQNTKTQAMYDAPVPGWYRLRGAFADAAGTASYDMRYDSPGPGGFRPIPASALRAPAGDVAGMIVDGFEGSYLISPVGGIVDAGTLGDISFTADPFGLPVGNSSFSLRFAAQVLIDVEGDYALLLQSSQGHRAWLDGASIASKFDVNSAQQTTMTSATHLAPGWHDLVVDLNRVSATSSRLDVKVASGPAWVGQPIPLDHMRPVVGRATRWWGALSTFSAAIPDGGTATRTLVLDVPTDMVGTGVETYFRVSHTRQSTLEVKLATPTGAVATLAGVGSLVDGGASSRYGALQGSTAGSTWGFQVTDTSVDTTTGSFTEAGVTVIGIAGPAPFSGGYRYASAPRDLGDAMAISAIKWGLRQATALTKVAASLRTCDSAAECESQPWTAVAEGAIPAVTPRRFAQYMLEVTGTDDNPTAIDWVEVTYRAPLR